MKELDHKKVFGNAANTQWTEMQRNRVSNMHGDATSSREASYRMHETEKKFRIF